MKEKIKSDALDFAIIQTDRIPGTDNDNTYLNDFAWFEIAKIENTFCVHKDHPLAKREDIVLEEIGDEPLVVSPNQVYIDQLFMDKNLKMNIIHRSSQSATICRFISEGVASGIVYKNLARDYPDIVELSFNPPIIRSISIMWNKKRELYGGSKLFLNFCRSFNLSEMIN